MSKDNEKAKIFTRRALLLGGAQALLFSVIAGRLYYLQIVQGRMYRRRAENNRISVRIILPKRGRILDRYGVPLAINDQTFRVVILPSQVKKVDELLDKLSKFVTIEESDRKRIERDLRTQNDLNSIIVKDNISREQMDSIAVSSPDLIGADVDSGEVRVYPYGEITAHILGYVGAVAKEETDTVKNDIEKRLLRTSGFLIGKKGMEKAYEMKMRGISGTKEMEVNARGNVVRALSRREPVSGEDVQLSLDINLQQLAAARISHTIAASAVVMNIHTGEILAMVSRPSFDPNLFSFGISKKNWDILNNDTKAPLMNRAISGVYAPGSTFKMMTALAALEARVMEYGERVYCSGSYEFGERKFHCWKRDGHGRLNLIEAMAHSCDPYFYEASRRMGIDKLQAMALRFGLGDITGIDLPNERTGVVPGRIWKQTVKKERWQQGETLITSIGHGFILTTPLQLAVMTARIANGGFAVKPRMTKCSEQELEEPFHKRWQDIGINKEHLEIVQYGMFSAVNMPGSTGFGARILEEDKEMAGKTGTAQVRRISEAERKRGVMKNEDLEWRERDHSLFVAYAPYKKPKYAAAVVIEHGGSGALSAPIARDLLIECQNRKL